MKKLKENIKINIIKIASEEFMKNGFQNASMRIIAKKAGTTTSNIYNYYKSKDEILKSIIQSTLDELKNYYKYIEIVHIKNSVNSNNINETTEDIEKIIEFIDKNRFNLELIFFKSAGSEYQNYKDVIIEQLLDGYINYLNEFTNVNPEYQAKVSGFFLHTLSSNFVNFISEILMHKIPKKELYDYFNEFYIFNFYGWKNLINNKIHKQKQVHLLKQSRE